MPLYHVQDLDMPLWVIAPSMGAAAKAWESKVREENEIDNDEPCEEPAGVSLICQDYEILLSKEIFQNLTSLTADNTETIWTLIDLLEAKI